MATTNMIQFALPEHVESNPDDLELLSATLQAIVGLRYERSQEWRRVRDHLNESGWSVEWGLQWHVVARRGGEREEACGRTRDEAFARLDQVTRVESVGGTP